MSVITRETLLSRLSPAGSSHSASHSSRPLGNMRRFIYPALRRELSIIFESSTESSATQMG